MLSKVRDMDALLLLEKPKIRGYGIEINYISCSIEKFNTGLNDPLAMK